MVGQTPAPGKCVLLSTSRVFGDLMNAWVISDAGDRWSVKLDVRDLGGHLDTTLRGRAATLVGRVLVLLARILVVLALPLDFAGRLMVLRTKFLPGALHGIEASSLSLGLLRRLRSAFVSAVWSRRMPLAHIGAVLCFMGLLVVILDFIPSGEGLGYFVGIWLIGHLRFQGCIASWIWFLLVVLGMGLCTCWFRVLALLVFFRDSGANGWVRPGLPLLSHLAGPHQRDKALLRGVLSGGVWNGFLLGHAMGEIVPCRFCGEFDGDRHLFWACTHTLWFKFVKILSFMI